MKQQVNANEDTLMSSVYVYVLLYNVRGEFKNKCDSSNISVQRRLANKLDKI